MGDLSRINTNNAALRSFLTLDEINRNLLVSQERIATGKVVNRASDSPANYYISKIFQKDISESVRAQKNIERGINFLESNDGKLARIADIVLEMMDLTEQANSGAVSSAEKAAIQRDLGGLRSEVNTILESGVSQKIYTNSSNPVKIGDITLSVSGTGASGTRTTLTGLSMSAASEMLQITGNAGNITTTKNRLASALNQILAEELQIGSYVRRLGVEMRDAENTEVNDRASLSTIQDADLAREQLELTKLQILQQSSLSMLAQANTAPQSILVLFGG